MSGNGRRLTNLLFYYKPHRPINIVPADMTFLDYCKKWYFLRNQYYKLGLYHDDIIFEFPDVKEAVRRLPREMKEARDWRAVRAVQLDLNHKYLPEEEWIQYEEDITAGRYLQPYIEEVRREKKEIDSWCSVY